MFHSMVKLISYLKYLSTGLDWSFQSGATSRTAASVSVEPRFRFDLDIVNAIIMLMVLW